MAHMPQEPEAFAEQVAILLKRLQPDYDVDLIGPRELIVNGRRLDLENLFRMVAHEPNRGTEIVEHFLDQLFSSDALSMADLSFELARPRIMPRIQPESIFEHLSRDLVAHVPFVNGTVIVFVLDMPQMTVSLTTEQTVRWNVSMEDLDTIARENLEARVARAARRLSSRSRTAMTRRGCCCRACTRNSLRTLAGISTSRRRHAICSWRCRSSPRSFAIGCRPVWKRTTADFRTRSAASCST
jgi:hypothetical protein